MLDKIRKFDFTIQGISPLLTHSPLAMATNGHAKPTRGTVVYDHEEEAERGTYRNANGDCCIPAIAVRNAIMRSSSFAKIKRIPLRQILAHIQIEPIELLTLIDPATGDPLRTYEVNVQRAVIQRAGIMRARPMFRDWAVKFSIQADTELLPDAEAILTAQLAEAGSRIGIGDYRPDKGGPYGRFMVVDG